MAALDLPPSILRLIDKTLLGVLAFPVVRGVVGGAGLWIEIPAQCRPLKSSYKRSCQTMAANCPLPVSCRVKLSLPELSCRSQLQINNSEGLILKIPFVHTVKWQRGGLVHVAALPVTQGRGVCLNMCQ